MNESGVHEERLFSTALALPPSERTGYLQRACADQTQYERLRALIDALDRNGVLRELMDSTAAVGGADIAVENYTLFEEVGEGGWGIVYRAEQTSPLQREVALKIIKKGMDTRALIQRFEAERQALAMMDHVNIAKVFDAGSTPSGRPYFAMELVRGIKITDYCDLTRASVAERLTLMMQVCNAIEHAHRKGVIHRDIKPSNVMVTLCDGAPAVKVIDFGIAKAIQGRLTDSTLLTAFDGFVGTPAYVSPEQTECGGPRVDARSDVYSLGVLLYELLCGSTPFASSDASPSGQDRLRTRICSEEPLSPSKHVSALARAAGANLSQRTRTSKPRLVRQLQGDLDWVVMRCLEKDPGKRYQSVFELSADLQRYLRDEPVIDRPRRLAHSIHKFARRHRAAFAAGSATVVMLLASTAVTTWLAIRAVRANQLAQSVTNFLQNDLLVQDLSIHQSYPRSAGKNVMLLTVLDHASDKAGERFSDEPLVEAAIRGTLGRAYDSLGADERARAQFERARMIYEERYGVTDRRTLAMMAKGVSSLAKVGKHDEAERLGTRALLHCERVLGPGHVETLALSTTMAFVWLEQGRIDKARELEWIVDTQKAVFGEAHATTLQTLLIFAAIAAKERNFGKAEELARTVLTARARALGESDPDTLQAAHALQAIHALSGKCGYAEGVRRIYDARYPVRQSEPLEHLVVVATVIRPQSYHLSGLPGLYLECPLTPGLTIVRHAERP